MKTIQENKEMTNECDENEEKIDLTYPLLENQEIEEKKVSTQEERYLNDTIHILKSKDRTLLNYQDAIQRCDLELSLINEMNKVKQKKYNSMRLKIIKEKAVVVEKSVELKRVAKFYQDIILQLQNKLKN